MALYWRYKRQTLSSSSSRPWTGYSRCNEIAPLSDHLGTGFAELGRDSKSKASQCDSAWLVAQALMVIYKGGERIFRSWRYLTFFEEHSGRIREKFLLTVCFLHPSKCWVVFLPCVMSSDCFRLESVLRAGAGDCYLETHRLSIQRHKRQSLVLPRRSVAMP